MTSSRKGKLKAITDDLTVNSGGNRSATSLPLMSADSSLDGSTVSSVMNFGDDPYATSFALGLLTKLVPVKVRGWYL